MSLVTIEGHLIHTAQEVETYLADALKIAERLYPSGSAPDAVLIKLIELLSTKTVVTAQPQQVALDPTLAASLRGNAGLR